MLQFAVAENLNPINISANQFAIRATILRSRPYPLLKSFSSDRFTIA